MRGSLRQFAPAAPPVPRLAIVRLAALALPLLGGCRREPSPEQVQQVLVAHPEIVAAAVKAHPREVFEALQGAAQELQAADARRGDSLRTERFFANPLKPEIAGRAALGAATAPVTIVEYTDFQCPYCRVERDSLVALLKEYAGKVRLVVKQFPLDIHPHARAAALMFEAIARQDPAAAYRFYDDCYTNQAALGRDGLAFLRAAAQRSGVDVNRAVKDAASPALDAVVNADLAEVEKFGFNGTPAFLINGVPLTGARPLSQFRAIIDRHLAAR